MDKELIIFNIYKDTSIKSKEFRGLCIRKFKMSDNQITNLLAKINQYQIKKYGTSYYGNYFITDEEKKKLSVNSRSRKRKRKNNYYK